MIKGIKILLFPIFLLTLSFLTGCTTPAKKPVKARVEISSYISISNPVYNWNKEIKDELAKKLGEKILNKRFKTTFICEQNVYPNDENGIIYGKNYYGIPEDLYDNNFRYIFFSDGDVPDEVDPGSLTADDIKKVKL